ncbi:MAG: hypothetical protein J5979_02205 [Lachnospiraceae bacterium]|nr:hypothetical protein [Lachnospiraceae bacterium]
MYEYWCELEIVRLHIFSEFLLKDGMLKYEEKIEKDNKEVVNLYLHHYTNRQCVSYHSHTYREKMMSQKGFYIGHHFGDKAYLRIENNEIHLCSNNYNRIIWSYVVKYVLTIKCLEYGWLHLKAAAVDYNNEIYIIFGRGGSGKTELIKKMSSFGGKIISNTHLIVREKDIIGIESNIRVRDDEGLDFYLPPEKCFDNCEFGKNIHPVKALIWCNYRNDKNGMITEMKTDYMLSLVRKFGNALDAWELKEDVFDYYLSDPVLISQKLIQNDTLLKDLIRNRKNYYFNLNVFESEDSDKLLNFLK